MEVIVDGAVVELRGRVRVGELAVERHVTGHGLAQRADEAVVRFVHAARHGMSVAGVKAHDGRLADHVLHGG